MGSESTGGRRRWVVLVSFAAMVPSAGVITLVLLRWWHASTSWMAVLGAIALFGALSVSIGRITLRAFIRRTQAEPPLRAFLTAAPIPAIVFIPLVWNVIANALIRMGKTPARDEMLVPAIALSCVLALAYAYPIFAAARALATDALDSLETALFGGAVSLGVMSNFLRVACEAQHFHDDARLIGIAFAVAALAFAVAAAVASLLRWRWARAAFRNEHVARGVIPWESVLHAGVPPLDVAGRGEGDGVIVRFAGDGAKVPYRDAAHSVALARTWLDERRALSPLVRRIVGSAIVLVAATTSVGVVAGDGPERVHLEREDRSAREPTGSVHFPASCTRQDPIVLIPMGVVRGVNLDGLARSYSLAYQRPVVVAPMRTLPEGSFNDVRHQWSAEAILDDITPKPEEEPGPVRIAITSTDLYIEHESWNFAFGLRRAPNLAVVSNARMREFSSGVEDQTVTTYRLRKMITRDLGILYCGMTPNDNPESVMFKRNMSLHDLDRMDESIW